MLDISDALRATERAVVEHEKGVQRALEEARVIALNEVRVRPGFTHRTHATERATQGRIVRTAGGKLLRLSNTKPWARALDGGARPHPIEARGSKMLRFVGRNGQLVFRRRVMHPGNKPYRFLRNATGTAYTRLEKLLEREMNRVSKNFGR